MVYEYECKWGCGSFDVIKQAWRSPIEERCPYCLAPMNKVYRPLYVQGQTFKAGYYPHLGARFSTKAEFDNATQKYEGETGKKVIEVGNEREAMRKLKPERKKPNIEAALHEMKTHKVDFNA